MIPLRLLLVNDDPSVRWLLGGTLTEAGYEVSTAEHAEQALARLDESLPDLIFSDIRMPGLDGIELLRLARERTSVDVILMTAFDDMPTVGWSRERSGAWCGRPTGTGCSQTDS